MESLHRRLVLILLSLILASWLVSVVITALYAKQTLIQQIDQQLVHYMDVSNHSMGTIYEDPKIIKHFQAKAVRLSSEPGVSRVRGFGSQGRELATNLWFKSTQVLVGNAAPAFPAPEGDGIIEADVVHDGETSTWRVLYRYDQSLDIWLATGFNMASVASMGRTAILRSVFPLFIILPLTIVILFWGVGRGLRPLGQLAEKIAARQPSALEPIDLMDVPKEIQPVVSSLNGLLDRLQRALVSERRFTSNAAHELQTPLAAIKAEVQRSQRMVSDLDSRRMLERIEVRVSRATETVRQLLTLARLDPEQEFRREPIPMNHVVIELMAEEGHWAADRQLDIEILEDPEVTVQGHMEWVTILIRNLLNNAFKYAVNGSVVQISLKENASGVVLSVANDCEPISDTEFHHLTDRFYSLPGRESGGVGLGLSIARRIADLHGATLSLQSRSEGRGFRAEVRFSDGLSGLE